MRMKGDKPIFNYIDTFTLDMTLGPIIVAGLRKFQEVVRESDAAGYPAEYEIKEPMKSQVDNPDGIAFAEWMRTIDQMIYAFEDNEPEIPDNILSLREVGEEREDGSQEITIDVLDQEAYDKYMKECQIHEDKCTHGRELFCLRYKHLWW